MSRLYLIAATLNALVLTFVLIAALIVQFMLGELPCPLCTMQRIAMMLCVLSPLFLLAQNRRAAITHRDLAIAGGMSIFAALLGVGVSGRQVLLHILPDDPGYGGTVFGMHLYTICLLVFICHALAAAAMLIGATMTGSPAQLQRSPRSRQLQQLQQLQQLHWPVTKGIFFAFGLVVLINLLAVIAQAGWHWMLPPDPVSYLLLSK